MAEHDHHMTRDPTSIDKMDLIKKFDKAADNLSAESKNLKKHLDQGIAIIPSSAKELKAQHTMIGQQLAEELAWRIRELRMMRALDGLVIKVRRKNADGAEVEVEDLPKNQDEMETFRAYRRTGAKDENGKDVLVEVFEDVIEALRVEPINIRSFYEAISEQLGTLSKEKIYEDNIPNRLPQAKYEPPAGGSPIGAQEGSHDRSKH